MCAYGVLGGKEGTVTSGGQAGMPGTSGPD